MRTCSLLLLIAAIVCATVSPAASEPCPWRAVDNVGDPFFQNLGKWAVEQQSTPLRFDKVESARVQGVDECFGPKRNFELIIDASNRVGAGDYKYKAVVYVEYIHPQKLVSFGFASISA